MQIYSDSSVAIRIELSWTNLKSIWTKVVEKPSSTLQEKVNKTQQYESYKKFAFMQMS